MAADSVTFEIIELPYYSGVGTDNKVVIGEIKAHKYFLATRSKVLVLW